MRWLAALLIWLAVPALATQDAWPALFDVTGVASDDVLNIRERPSVDAPILSSLSARAVDVEVIAINDDETWGMVNTGERIGWASLRFLERQPEQWTYSYPEVASCFGTEPFWTLSLTPEVAFSTPVESLSGEVIDRLSPVNRLDRFGLTVDVEHGIFRAVIQRQHCSDGMSDRAYGIEINAFYKDGMLSGCCTLSR